MSLKCLFNRLAVLFVVFAFLPTLIAPIPVYAAGVTGDISLNAASNNSTNLGTGFNASLSGGPSIASASTILAANTPPDIMNISDTTTYEDQIVSVHCGARDAETNEASLVFSVTSSNPTLVPVGNIVITSPGREALATITPVANQNGETTITITVSDGELTDSSSFTLTVNPVNDLPTISSIDDVTINEGTSSAAIPFTVGDVETDPASLVVIVKSDLPTSCFTFTNSGANRTVTITPPVEIQTGSFPVKFKVLDGSDDSEETFTLTVNAVPVISAIANQTTNEDTPITINFTATDTETAGSSLSVSGSSSNTTLVPNAGISFGGSGNDRSVTITPAANQSGTATISLVVADASIGRTTRTFDLTVTPVNDSPTITVIANQTTKEDTPITINFTIGDLETSAANLSVSGSSANTTLVPSTGISFDGSGDSRTVTLTPAANLSGSAAITISVTDGDAAVTSRTFTLTVTAVNDAPTITAIAGQTINVNTATSAIPFTIGDLETAAGSLTLSATSSNTTLVPTTNIVFGNSGANRTVTITPAANQTGTATITVNVSDGSITTPTSFTLTVNSLPTISDIADQATTKNIPTAELAFTVGDAETPAANLVVSAVSSNTNLVPTANIALGGSGASRTVKVTPAAAQKGTATITVTVSDGVGSASDSFVLTVTITVLRVAANGSATSNCDSWANACTLNRAIAIAVDDDDIWVKAGTYVPGTARDSSFNLRNGARFYGGFAGTETARSQRNWAKNASILSGELSGDNICHVVKGSDLASTTVLDGFTITAGAASVNGTICETGNGGGMALYLSNPTLANLIIRDNTADTNGSGIYISGGAPKLFNVIIFNNTGGPLSSGVYVNGGDPAFVNTTFAKNILGLQMLPATTVTIHNSIFWDNETQIYYAGGSTPPTITHSLIKGGCPGMTTCSSLVADNPDPLFANTTGGDLRLKPGSPAIDVGLNSYAPLDTYDVDGDGNTGESYPYDLAVASRFFDHPAASPTGAIVDLGAYEAGPNTAPVFTYSANQALNSIDEDPVTNTGVLLKTLMSPSYLNDMITDPDPGAQEGIAITVADSAIGKWQYSLNGTDWSDVGSVSDSTARLLPLDDTTRLRFAPNANASGRETVSFRAWDLTSGSIGGTADATTNGGTSAFSATLNYANIIVIAVNDPPTITAIANQIVPKNTSSGALDFTIGDVDNDISTLTLSASSSNSEVVPASNVVFDGSGANRTVTITPAANRSGKATITLTLSDGTDSSASTSFEVKVPIIPLHVTPNGLAEGQCASWATACTFQYALSIAVIGDEVWVKAGTYIPGSDRDDTFGLKNGVGIYGGFAGDETARSLRNWSKNVSILSGKIGDENREDNICSVVSGINLDYSAGGGNPPVMDGFTISGGYSTSYSGPDSKCIFKSGSDNTIVMAGNGGAIALYRTSPRLSNLIIRDNDAEQGGGGIYVFQSNLHVVNGTFINNSGGGILSLASDVEVNNSTFYKNYVGLESRGSASADVHNSIFWGNDSAIAMTNYNEGDPYVHLNLEYSLSQNGCSGTTSCSNVISGNPDPMFVDAAAGNFHLLPGSPAIDAGSNSLVTSDTYDWDEDENTSEAIPFDGAANARFFDYPGAGSSETVDMGAYETDDSNTAPVLDDRGNPTLTGILEDPDSNPGTLISAMLSTGYNGNPISDPDAGAREGIAVTAAENTFGKWQFSLNGTTWTDLGSPSESAARLLPATASLRFVPDLNASGTVAIAFRAWDLSSGTSGGTGDTTTNGGSTAFSTAVETASLTVTPVDDAPTISDISNRTIDENTSTGEIAFTIGDAETSVSLLTLTSSSDNLTLVPAANIVISGSGASRTVKVTPDLYQDGTAKITLTVSDGELTSSDSFILTVNHVNQAPTITGISNQTIDEDTATDYITFTIGDRDNDVNSLTVFGGSDNYNLVGDNIVFGGSGANRAVKIIPRANRNGSTLITICVTDDDPYSEVEGEVARIYFTLTVNAVNDPPVNTSLPTISPDGTHKRQFSVTNQGVWNDDADGGATTLTYTYQWQRASDDQGTGLTDISVATGQTYTATASDANQYVRVKVTATDNGVGTPATASSSADSAYLMVTNANPVAVTDDLTTDEDKSVNLLALANDSDADGDSLSITGMSSPSHGTAVFSGDRITYTPEANYSGPDSFTYSLSDGFGGTATGSVNVTVRAVNDAPALTDLSDQIINEDTRLSPLSFTVGDVETAAADLTVIAISSNPALVPVVDITLDGTGADRTVAINPAADQNGEVTITITVSDGELTTSDSFVLTVKAVNDAPTISNVSDQTTDEDKPTGAIDFTIGDIETAAADLIVTATSSNPELVPAEGIALDGDGATRTVTVTPAADQNGTATITLTVSDGELSTATDSFVLTVSAVNDTPTISDTLDQTTDEDKPTGDIAFTVGDVETAAADLIVTASSSNPELVPAGGITLDGDGADHTISITPAANQSGTATITLTVSDGEKTASDSFVLTVKAVNDTPTISDIPNQSTDEDKATGAIDFSVGDVETAAADLSVTAVSSNPALVPAGGITLDGSGADRTVAITPAANRNGKTTITLMVSDGEKTASHSFVLTVKAVNDTPTISDVPDQSTDEDKPTGEIDFTVGDMETAAADLTVTATSSNPALVPAAGIHLSGTSTDRTVTLTPAANQSGTATITLTVSDGELTAADSFVLTVSAVNDTPTISDIPDQSTDEDKPTGAIDFTIGDVETAAADLTVTAVSDNPALVPAEGITLGGTGADRTISITSAANQSGTATITLTVSDGELAATDSFVLTVSAVNDTPTISDTGDQSTDEDKPTGAIDFTIGDVETAAADLSVTAVSSNPALVPAGGITLGGTGADRTISITPAANQGGTATITLTVSDGEKTASDSFVLTVKAVNDTPTISDIPDQTTDEDTPTGAIDFTLGDVETAAAGLTVTAVSSNPALVPAEGITLDGTGADRTISITPAADQNGTATITLTVSDGEKTASDSFVLTVKAVNDTPTISDTGDQATDEDKPTGVIDFTIGDVETDAADLSVTAVSSNPDLVPAAGITLGGTGADRTINITPAANQNGAATITLTVSDGELATATDSFVLTVRAVNDTPTISDVPDQSTDEDTPTGAIDFTIGDVETAAADLTVTAVSDNPALVPAAGITLGGSTADRTVTISPAAEQYGTSTITITVSDGEKTASDSFVLTVRSDNDTPTISDILDQNTEEDVPTGAIAFTVGDVETAAADLSVTATSSNVDLVPAEGITQGGTGADRTIRIKPAADQSGTATITLIVSDGELAATDSFVLTVSAVNDTPTISDTGDQSTDEDKPTGAIDFTVGDVETAAADLSVTAVSSNLDLVPAEGITLGGTGADRTISITPAANQNGTATITLTVSDGELTATDSFVLTVKAVNDTPTISDLSDQAINEDQATGAIDFTIGDVETAAAGLTVTAVSSNPALVPAEGITLDGTGADRTISITPAANQNGEATITLTVSDGEKTASDSFVLTVKAVNDAPTISDTGDQATAEDTPLSALPITLSDLETPAGELVLSAVSSNTALLPASSIVLDGTGADRTITITPAANQSGTATITLTVSDGELTAVDSFVLTVSAVNDTPTISDLPDQSTDEDTPTGAIDFTIGDVETAAADLSVTAVSSNPTLVPAGGITLSGTGADRTISITPAAEQNGAVTITITVSDGEKTASDSFVLTVRSDNDAPTISDTGDKVTDEDTPTGAIDFTVGDIETAAADLSVTASSSNPALVPVEGITLGGTGADRTVTIIPASNQSGTATITLTVSDGELAATDSFVLTVKAVNDAPVISDTGPQLILEDTRSPIIPFTVFDVDTDVNSLTVTAVSSNADLVPDENIHISGSGANRAVVITPLAGQNGKTIITLTVSDGKLTASDSFVLIVEPVNDAPTISDITDQVTAEDTATGAIDFTVGDAETAAADLVVTAVSSNPDLVPAEGFTLGGAGANRTVTITPAANQSGKATITLTVSDGELTNTSSFELTVNPVNDAPVISDITGQATDEDVSTGAIAFTIGDVETAAADLTVTAVSDNPGLMPTEGITLGGTGTDRTVTLTPAANQSGTATITLTVTDGELTASDSFTLTVRAVNDPPVISDTGDQTTDEDRPLNALPLTLSDLETPAGSLTLSATSSNPELIPAAGIVFGGSGADRTVTLTPLADQNGTAVITLTVSDGELTASDSFTLTVNPVNDAPEISSIPDQIIDEDTSTPPIHFMICDIDTDCELLSLTAASSNTDLVPVDHVVLSGFGEHRTVVITPAANQYGTAVITLTVSDGEKSASESFTLAVRPVNDPPVISKISDQTIDEDSSTGAITFSIEDVENPVGLTLSASSSNTGLVPAGGILLGGSGTERTLTLTPAADQNGTASITLTVSDGEKTASDSLVLTVNAINDAPVNTSIPVIGADADHSRQLSIISKGDWNDNADGATTLTYTYQWQRASDDRGTGLTDISGVTGLTYQATAADMNQYVRVQVTASDDGVGVPASSSASAFSAFLPLTNTRPAAVEDDLTTDEDQSADLLALTNDSDADGDSLSITGLSSPTHGTAVLSGERITYTPTANYNGSDSFSYTLSDGLGGTATGAVNVTVRAINDAPTISNLSDQTVEEGATLGPLSFSVGDVETGASELTVTATSSNTALVPAEGITFGGTGADRTVTLTPAATQNGATTITLTVSDGELTASDSFVMTVKAINNTPTITDILDQTTDEDTTTGAIAFTIGDAESAAADLTVTATSSNPGLVPTGGIKLGGTGAARTVTLSPAADQNGATTLTLTVSDGELTASDSFVLTVKAVNDTPTISDTPDQTTAEDKPAAVIHFAVGDIESAATDLIVSASSANPALVPPEGIALGGSGTDRTVSITPAAGQSGTAAITLTVSDGSLTASDSFTLTVTPVNHAPTITVISNQTTPEDTPSGKVDFRIADTDTGAASLTVTAASSNTDLIPAEGISLDGAGESRTITLTPAVNQSGSSLITLTVSDGALTSHASFTLTVSPVNDAPVLASIGDRRAFTGELLSFAVSAADVDGDSLTYTLDPGAPEGAAIDATSGLFTWVPAARGTYNVSVRVSDGSTSTTDDFEIVVTSMQQIQKIPLFIPMILR